MFLKDTMRFKDGKEHHYWSLVENRRVDDGRKANDIGAAPGAKRTSSQRHCTLVKGFTKRSVGAVLWL